MINYYFNRSLENAYLVDNISIYVTAKAHYLNSCLKEIVERIDSTLKNLIYSPQEQQRQLLITQLQKYKTKAGLIPAEQDKTLNVYLQNFQKINSLEFNLELATELLAETLKAVPFSANNIDRSREVIERKAMKKGIALNDLSPIVEEASKQRAENIMESLLENNKQKKSLFNQTKILAKNVQGAFIGNCLEMAAVALFKGIEKGVNVPIHIVGITNGDHYFLVIGRDSQSNPNDYTTWGPNAVVMDPWANKIYKLSDLEQNLYDYIGSDNETGKPHLRKFNPTTQRLFVYTENICSTHDLLESKKGVQMNTEQDKIYQNAIELLEKLHQAKTLPGKLEVAKSLKETILHPDVSSLGNMRYLMDQINHFIELSSN